MTTLREAAQQALEALEAFLSDELRPYEAAKTAANIRAALAQPESPQRKPLSLTDLQEALVLTNLIDRDAIDNPDEYDEGSTLAQIDELYRIIERAHGIIESEIKEDK